MAPTEDSGDRRILDEAGFSRRLERGRRPAVVVVDLSRGFTDPASIVGADLDAVVTATTELIGIARDVEAPVVFTTIAFRPGSGDAGIWLEKAPGLAALEEGSPMVAIDERLPVRPGDPLIVKKGASAFFGTNLSAVLTARGVDSLLVCGTTTSGCVRATVVDAMQLGFRTLVPRECVGDRAPDAHDANLLDMDAKYGDVVSLEDACSYLAGIGGAGR